MPNATTGRGLSQLDGLAIERTLGGKLVHYDPEGWADSGVHEEYHPGGRWRGIHHARGPVSFAGRWEIRDDALCVTAERGLTGARWQAGWVCRPVWRDGAGDLRIEHVATPHHGLMTLDIRPLP